MYEKNSIEGELERIFKLIFKAKKVSFDAPGDDMPEQQCLFIELENARNKPSAPTMKSMVTGNAYMMAQGEQIPLGFFSKAIQQAKKDMTKDLFFFDIEANALRRNNLVKRGFSFTYFFSSQYDPEVGTIEEVDINVTET